MASNDYYGNRGSFNRQYGSRPYANGNGDRRNQGYSSRSTPEEIKPLALPADYVDEAEKVIRSILNERNKITTSKIRNILSLVSDIYNVENLRTEKTLADESKTALIMMRIRVVYEAGREEATKTFVKTAKLLEYMKDIGDSREKLINFSHYMEALVAYHRFLIGGKEG